MDTFAEQLSGTICRHDRFWSDFDWLARNAISRLIPGVLAHKGKKTANGDESLGRLQRSALIFSQTSDDVYRGLAQEIALYSAVAYKEDVQIVLTARDLLHDIGNHPGAQRLGQQFDLPTGSLISFLRNAVLAAGNRVSIAGADWNLTDFQHKVWYSLPRVKATAISAPTSAGKSFVVLEYLALQALSTAEFTAVFVAPTRALLGEIHAKVARRLENETKSIRVSTIPTLDSEQRSKQVFVLTQERLQVLLAIWDGPIDLLIVDEAQAIGDDARGMILQDCIEVIQSRSTATRFLFLAPGATGFEAFSKATNVDSVNVEETELSPVLQNRIIVGNTLGNENSLDISLLTEKRLVRVGTYKAKRGFGNADTRLAAVALELGSSGGSLVYGTGPAAAEGIAQQIASDLPEQSSSKLKELASFITKHVHPKYSLARQVLKGVGVHYGKMPGLLREALESAFKDSALQYLVCTTTLFQGVNLPARNVFIDTPTRGKGHELDPAALWNFAGRAGRLGQDIVGNVFLVGYESWETQPLSDRARFSIAPAFRGTIDKSRKEVVECLRGGIDGDAEKADLVIESAAGLLISRAARGTVERFVDRTLTGTLSQMERQALVSDAKNAFSTLGLPVEAVTINWTVNPFGQARLLKRFREKIAAGQTDSLIPIHPSPLSKTLHARYAGIFGRLNREIFGKSAPAKFNSLLASMSLAWMRGDPLPVLIDREIKYQAASKSKVNVDSAIRKVFNFIEDTLRFKYVQLGRAYIDLLRFALRDADLLDHAKSVYDFPLALELGVSSVAGQAFVELGLSRITAATLEGLIPHSNPTVERARGWLASLKLGDIKVGQVIWDELEQKGLVGEVATFAA